MRSRLPAATIQCGFLSAVLAVPPALANDE